MFSVLRVTKASDLMSRLEYLEGSEVTQALENPNKFIPRKVLYFYTYRFARTMDVNKKNECDREEIEEEAATG